MNEEFREFCQCEDDSAGLAAADPMLVRGVTRKIDKIRQAP